MGELAQDTKVAGRECWLQGVFQLFGLGRELGRNEDPDAYVRQLREGWNELDLS